MGLVIGMDEAGYGPNLGPLVITTTVWQVPGNPRDTDFWREFEDVVSQDGRSGSSRLHIADSKQVYSPARGLKSLERSVLATLRLLGHSPDSLRELCGVLSSTPSEDCLQEPWFAEQEVLIPHAVTADDFHEPAERWRECCADRGIELRAIRSDIVLTERFNDLTRRYDSKGVALSRSSLSLLRSVWNPDDGEPTLVVADKHGGRNRYDQLLSEVLDDRLVMRLEEKRECSRYRIGESEVRFQMKAESHFPVAISSMVCKYVRELGMIAFNHFWQQRVPNLKPTKGYPADARRFKDDIGTAQTSLGIADETLWRHR